MKQPSESQNVRYPSLLQRENLHQAYDFSNATHNLKYQRLDGLVIIQICHNFYSVNTKNDFSTRHHRRPHDPLRSSEAERRRSRRETPQNILITDKM